MNIGKLNKQKYEWIKFIFQNKSFYHVYKNYQHKHMTLKYSKYQKKHLKLLYGLSQKIGGSGWAEWGRKLLIFHHKPWIIFKLWACITSVKIKMNFKNLKMYLLILMWKILIYSHVLISLIVSLEGTQSFFSDLKLLKFVVRKGTKSNVEEDRGREGMRELRSLRQEVESRWLYQ